VLIDLPVEDALARADAPNRFEAETLAFHTRIRAGYLRTRPRRAEPIPRAGRTAAAGDPQGVAGAGGTGAIFRRWQVIPITEPKFTKNSS
jgi:hypothetical protein